MFDYTAVSKFWINMGNEIADKKLQFIGTNNDLKKEDMDSIIIKVDNERVILTDGTKSTIINLFSGCRVNFLLGAGFSANLLGTLSNNASTLQAKVTSK